MAAILNFKMAANVQVCLDGRVDFLFHLIVIYNIPKGISSTLFRSMFAPSHHTTTLEEESELVKWDIGKLDAVDGILDKVNAVMDVNEDIAEVIGSPDKVIQVILRGESNEKNDEGTENAKITEENNEENKQDEKDNKTNKKKVDKGDNGTDR